MNEPKINSEEAFSLVGQFLHIWALTEASLNNVVGAAINLTNFQQAIVCSNIQLRDKVHIARTAITLLLPSQSQEASNKLLKNVADFATSNRNMVAHNLFGANDDGTAVEFLLVKAKGELRFPDVNWTRADFHEKYQTMRSLANDLRELAATLQKSPANKLAHFLAAPSTTPDQPGLLGLLSLPPQDDLDSDSANPQTDDKNPPSSEE